MQEPQSQIYFSIAKNVKLNVNIYDNHKITTKWLKKELNNWHQSIQYFFVIFVLYIGRHWYNKKLVTTLSKYWYTTDECYLSFSSVVSTREIITFHHIHVFTHFIHKNSTFYFFLLCTQQQNISSIHLCHKNLHDNLLAFHSLTFNPK